MCWLSIIILTYNSKEYIKQCLKSIFSQEACGIEVILVDNGSYESMEEFLIQNYPHIIFIRNPSNKGTAYARNQGLQYAKGRWVMFLDCDVHLQKEFLKYLKHILNNLPYSIGAVAPCIIDIQSQRIFSCGLKISPIFRVYDLARGYLEEELKEDIKPDAPNTCCGIYKKEVLEAIKEKNYFDEDFFFLFEDVDLGWRLKKSKYKTRFCPQLRCYHYGNSSATAVSLRRYYCFRNRWYMIIKYNHSWRLVIFLLRSFLYDLMRFIVILSTTSWGTKVYRDIKKYYIDKKKTHLNEEAKISYL